MSYTVTELAKKAGVSICTLHRHLHQGLAFAEWNRIKRVDKLGRQHAYYGWLITDAEAKRYIEYLASLVGFRSDGTLPSKKIIEMHDKGFDADEIARDTRTKPAYVKRAITQELNRRAKWQAQSSFPIAQT